MWDNIRGKEVATKNQNIKKRNSKYDKLYAI
jgi:hypothetical protein